MLASCSMASHVGQSAPKHSTELAIHAMHLTPSTAYVVTDNDHIVMPAHHRQAFRLNTLFAKGGASKFIKPADIKVISGGKFFCRGQPRSTVFIHGDRA